VRRREVRSTYDRIAEHFARTRPEPWEEVADFLDDRTGAVGLDVGVGNGRHAELLAGSCRRVVGLDLSGAALAQASRRSRERRFDLALVHGDATALPLRTGTVDLAVYVATVHHLSTRSLRIESLGELARVLSPAGCAIVSAWCVTHDRFDTEVGFDTSVDWTLPDGEVVERFYHVYDPAEFERDLAATRLAVERSFVSYGNCYAVVGGG
jgi:ubiquinone/menaquinone biosynthesis C-methylase UbiE